MNEDIIEELKTKCKRSIKDEPVALALRGAGLIRGDDSYVKYMDDLLDHYLETYVLSNANIIRLTDKQYENK